MNLVRMTLLVLIQSMVHVTWSQIPSPAGSPRTGTLVPQSFEKTITKKVSSKYLLYLPQDYNKDTLKHWPLILCLHGKGERGNDLNAVRRNGVAGESGKLRRRTLENSQLLPRYAEGWTSTSVKRFVC